MGQRFNVNNDVDTTLVTVAETVVATLTGVYLQRIGQGVRLHGQFNITTGGSTTAVTARIRRDSLVGALVGEATADQIEAAAGSTEDHDIVRTDFPPGELANATYVLTVQQTAAAANGTVLNASLEATTD